MEVSMLSQNYMAGELAGHSLAEQLPIEKTLEAPARCFPQALDCLVVYSQLEMPKKRVHPTSIRFQGHVKKI